MKKLLLIVGLSFSLSAQAGLWDDIKGMVSEDEDEQAATTEAAVEKASEMAPPTVSKDTAAETAGAVTQLLPLVTGTLGVTERQARGGLGAIFQASKSVLEPADFALIGQYVPEMDQLMAEAPATNNMMGGALQMAGIGASGTAAANLLSQFNDLGLGTDMIMKYSQLTSDYLKDSSPDLASSFTDSIMGLLN